MKQVLVKVSQDIFKAFPYESDKEGIIILGSMLQLGRQLISLKEFKDRFRSKWVAEHTAADFINGDLLIQHKTQLSMYRVNPSFMEMIELDTDTVSEKVDDANSSNLEGNIIKEEITT